MDTAKIRQWLKAKIAAEPDIVALIGARVYPLQIPQEPTYPAVAYFTQTQDAAPTKMPSSIDLVTVQFHIVAPRLEDCEPVESAFRAAFDFATGTTAGITIQEARWVSSSDMLNERLEMPAIVVTYRFRMYHE
jgi:Protein of unknown function (DUF3168)